MEDRARAVITGLALGDAMGVIAEGMTAEQIQRTFGRINDLNTLPLIDKILQEADGTERSLNQLQRFFSRLPLPGLYSDDTQQALIIADCLIKHHRIDRDYLVSSWLKMADYPRSGSFGLFRNAGPGFTEAMSNLKRGKSHLESGAISAGNGAAMRIAPVGICFSKDLEALKQNVIEASLLTHRDIRGIAAAGAIAYAVAYCISRDSRYLDFTTLLEDLYLFVRDLEDYLSLEYTSLVWEDFTIKQMSESIRRLDKILDLEQEAAIARLDSSAAALSKDPRCRHNHPFAPGSVVFSLYLFIRLGNSPAEAVITAVNGGGDTDTIAAMTGALCGALHGLAAFPPVWYDQLINCQQIDLRARALGEKDFDLTCLQDLYEMEKASCEAEDLFRRHYQQVLQKKFFI